MRYVFGKDKKSDSFFCLVKIIVFILLILIAFLSAAFFAYLIVTSENTLSRTIFIFLLVIMTLLPVYEAMEVYWEVRWYQIKRNGIKFANLFGNKMVLCVALKKL